MGRIAIIGKQQPRFIREAMVKYLEEQGHEAVLLDMPTRNTADWKEELVGYDCLISAGEKIPAETISFLKGSLKLISRFGVGTDEMDHAEAVRQGIAICNAAGSFNRPVAECALGMIIALMRNMILGNMEVHNCDWSRFNESRNGIQLYDKTIGLVGFGGISQQLAKMLSGFDCHIIAYDPFFDEEAGKKYGVKSVDLETLIRTSDAISLHCPCTDETRDMVNMDFLKKMKPTAVLVNTGRGALIVEEDLAEARAQGDTSDNAGYREARRLQAKAISRIKFLQKVLQFSRVIDTKALPKDKVSLLSTVEFTNLVSEVKMKYTIVSPHEMDLSAGKISLNSPIGRALMGRMIGEVVDVEAPSGVFQIRIESIDIPV